MASNNWNQNDNRFNFRLYSGDHRYTSSSRGSNRGSRSYNHSSTTNNNYNQEPREQNYRSSNYGGHYYGNNPSSSSQAKANDDETKMYAVNLQLKPVEMGIAAKSNSWKQEFKGLGAFNHYFGLLSPSNSVGYTLPDIWDGYFHITLAKFITSRTPDDLDQVFRTFVPPVEDLPYISDILFRASRIDISDGRNRPKKRQGINFVVLPIDPPTVTESFYDKVQPLLRKIKEQTEPSDWNVTREKDLHVTIRKYSNINFDLNKIKIREFPLEFRCSHLEVKQTREQAIDRFKNARNNSYRWWTGATESNGKCSYCSTPIISDSWEGFCLACGKYESIIPVWSTDGRNMNHCYEIQQQEIMRDNNTPSRLFEHSTLHE